MKTTRTLYRRFTAVLAVVLCGCVCMAGERGNPLPSNLPPLPQNWKDLAYAGLTKDMKQKAIDKTKYQFLDAPVPCSVTQHSKIVFSPKKKEFQGYGGLVAIRSKGLLFEGDRLHFYLLDGQGNLMFDVKHMDLQFYTTNPQLYTWKSVSTSKSQEITVTPHVGMASMQKLSAFRKAKLATLPAYQ